ncbi:helix-turn-helix transcriptional regulator [Sphingomonas sp. MS122]|uniref:helix-turn-helix transcriptional regulator n=1 Tax=Sphingomonas sp. MS122 TaxID=3412683 RepID=UPI003C30631B
MTRDAAQYKIETAAEMVVTALPPLDQHPGPFIRDVLLPEYGLKNISDVARRLGVDRAGFIGTLNGKHDVSRDLAYKLGALTNDHVADFLIAYQHAYDLAKERDKREAYKAKIARVPPVERAAEA